jgi:hypothetical protein
VLIPVGLSGDWLSPMLQDEYGNDDEDSDTNKYVRLAPVAEGKGNNGVNTDTFLSRFSVSNEGPDTKESKEFLIGGAANLQEVNAGDLLITRDVTSLGYVHKGAPLPPVMTWNQMWMSTDVDTVAALKIELYCIIYCLVSVSVWFWRLQYIRAMN